MKKSIVMLLLCMTMLCTGCSENKQIEGKKEESSVETENQVESDTVEKEADTSEKQENVYTEKNKYGVYIGAEEVTELEMGITENGEQKVLCTIKLPMNCFLSSLCMNETGEEETMLETNGNLLADTLALGEYQKSGKIPSTIMMGIEGGVDNTYTITIVDAERISVESEKEYAPGGIEIGRGEGHDAYAYERTGQFDLVLAYRLNENWTLLVQNSGEVKDHMSVEEFGQEMYQLIMPMQ